MPTESFDVSTRAATCCWQTGGAISWRPPTHRGQNDWECCTATGTSATSTVCVSPQIYFKFLRRWPTAAKSFICAFPQHHNDQIFNHPASKGNLTFAAHSERLQIIHIFPLFVPSCNEQNHRRHDNDLPEYKATLSLARLAREKPATASVSDEHRGFAQPRLALPRISTLCKERQ